MPVTVLTKELYAVSSVRERGFIVLGAITTNSTNSDAFTRSI